MRIRTLHVIMCDECSQLIMTRCGVINCYGYELTKTFTSGYIRHAHICIYCQPSIEAYLIEGFITNHTYVPIPIAVAARKKHRYQHSRLRSGNQKRPYPRIDGATVPGGAQNGIRYECA